MSILRIECTSPLNILDLLTALLPKKDSAHFSLSPKTVRHSSCSSSDAASVRVRWTKNPTNTNELDLGTPTRDTNHLSASQPNGNPSWPIEIFLPPGFRQCRSLSLSRSLCVRGNSADPNRTAQIRVRLKQVV